MNYLIWKINFHFVYIYMFQFVDYFSSVILTWLSVLLWNSFTGNWIWAESVFFFYFLNVHQWQYYTMKILILFSLFALYVFTDSVNVEVSIIFVTYVWKRRQMYLNVFNICLTCLLLAYCACCYMSISFLNCFIFSGFVQNSAGQFFSSGHTNNWAVLVSVFSNSRAGRVLVNDEWMSTRSPEPHSPYIYRCARLGSGSITDMWPIHYLCTEALRDSGSQTGKQLYDILFSCSSFFIFLFIKVSDWTWVLS